MKLGRLSWPWLLLHWVIIINLVLEVLYGGWMVFAVIRPEGVSGPLGAAAADLPFEMMMTRRAYAMETWIALAGLSLYLGLTEILPRRLRPAPESTG